MNHQPSLSEGRGAPTAQSRTSENALAAPSYASPSDDTEQDSDDRKAFEAWMRREHPGVECRTRNALGTYTVSSVDATWEGWREGRAALRAVPQQPGERNGE